MGITKRRFDGVWCLVSGQMIGVLGMISCFSLSPSVKLYVLQRGLAGRQVVMINGSPLLLWNNVRQ